jgi:hypothetical protein
MNNSICVFLIAAVFGLVACNSPSPSSQSSESQASSSSQAPSDPQTSSEKDTSSAETKAQLAEAQRKQAVAEASLAYWKNWKGLLDSFKASVEPLSEYSVENSNALSSLNTQLADQVGQLSAVDVDPELASIAANAIEMYKSRARMFQEQANILSTWNEFVKKRDSDAAAGAAVIVFFLNEKDRFAIPKALAEEANQIKSEWNNNLALLEKQNQNIEALIANREAMKIKLESRYGIGFEKF